MTVAVRLAAAMFATALLSIAPATAQVAGQGRPTATINGIPGVRTNAAGTVVSSARLSTRVQNRVQARLRNRIDRFYSPQANASSPFVIAGAQTQQAERRATRR